MNSTKQCPLCGNTQLLLLRTLHIKICTDCHISIEWPLEKDQKPLLENPHE